MWHDIIDYFTIFIVIIFNILLLGVTLAYMIKYTYIMLEQMKNDRK